MKGEIGGQGLRGKLEMDYSQGGYEATIQEGTLTSLALSDVPQLFTGRLINP